MEQTVRICPQCGAHVIGVTAYCPRCDHPLADAETYRPVTAPGPGEETAAAAAVLPGAAALEQTSRQQAALPRPPANNFEDGYTAALPPQLIGITQAPQQMPAFRPIPPAPYTPPPLGPNATLSLAPQPYPSNYYLQQRTQAYRQAGYSLRSQSPYQVTLDFGKPLGVVGWLVALVSGIGLLWYLVLLVTSGFSRDPVYLIVERDGTLTEDGAGAAHVRRQRARAGRRWGFAGVVIFFAGLVGFALMVLGGVYAVQNYRAELEAAYPTVSLFSTSQPSDLLLDEARVQQAEQGVVIYSVIFALASLTLFSGLALTVVGYLHHAALRVSVPPCQNTCERKAGRDEPFS
ncbi:MAG: hypothetical protein HC915_18330 [Anaerolineae bacterium]|nr:hypothetical protein [Anaerolineae bacterium]